MHRPARGSASCVHQKDATIRNTITTARDVGGHEAWVVGRGDVGRRGGRSTQDEGKSNLPFNQFAH
eukprot:scaffold2482_cov196-Alexandrium_tamarense.AAC.25